jgi:hypothetical protein
MQVHNHGNVTFRGWLFSFVGDAPAVAQMVGTKQSFGPCVKNVCNLCEDAHKPKIHSPCAWLRCKCADDRQHDPGCACTTARRTAARDAEHQARPATSLEKSELPLDTNPKW